MKPAVPGRGAGSSKRSWDDTEGPFIAGNFASKKRALVIKAPTSRIPNCDFTHKRRLFQCMFAQDDEGGLRPQAEDDTAPVKRQRTEAQDIQLPRVGTINLESTHGALIKHTPLDQFWRECIGNVVEWAGKGGCEPQETWIVLPASEGGHVLRVTFLDWADMESTASEVDRAKIRHHAIVCTIDEMEIQPSMSPEIEYLDQKMAEMQPC
jgi:hypothetical protein